MATDLEKLVVQMSADMRGFERELQRGNGIANKQARAIEARFRSMNKNLDGIGRGAANSLITPLTGIAAVLSAREVLQYADAWTKAKNSLAVAGVVGAEQADVLDRIYQSAQANAAPLGAMAGLYGRAAQASDNLGATQADLLKFTDGVGVSLKVAGTSAEAAKGALVQLGQALGQSRVMAEEFNSVNEGARPILIAVANGLTAAGGSVNRLKQLVNDGKVSGQQFFQAFLKGLPTIQSMAANAIQTIEQGVTKVNNAFTKYIGQTDEGLGASQRLVLGLATDDVDHVIDGDAADQDVVVIHHRRGDPVMVGELPGHFLVALADIDGRLLIVDQAVDRGGVFVGHQRGQRHAAQVLVAAADHEQVIGVVRQFAAQAQVAQHHIDVDIGAYRHHVRVHQAAGAVLGIGQHLLQALAVLAVHRLEDFVDDRVRQVFDQVGQIVDVEVFDRGDDLVRVHVRQQAFAHVVADVDQHLAIVFRIDQAPDDLALARRQRFEQVADLGRRQGIDQTAYRAQPTAVQCIGQHPQLARSLVVAYGLSHRSSRGIGKAAIPARMRQQGCSARHYRKGMFQRIPRRPAVAGVHAFHLIPRLSARPLNNKGCCSRPNPPGMARRYQR